MKCKINQPASMQMNRRFYLIPGFLAVFSSLLIKNDSGQPASRSVNSDSIKRNNHQYT